MITIVHNPFGEERLGQLIIANLTSSEWTSFRAAVAFVKRSGVKHIASSLSQFAEQATVKISVGIDHCGSSFEGIDDLSKAIGSRGELWVFHNESARHSTFHPKIYLFSNAKTAECFIGSGNITEGGLFTNYEAFVHLRLNRKQADDREVLAQIEHMLDAWSVNGKGTALRVNSELLADLQARGYLPSESQINRMNEAARRAVKSDVQRKKKKVFASVSVPPPPKVTIEKRFARTARRAERQSELPSNGFVITLQNVDVGTANQTKGKSHSPELFIPKVCVIENPSFWGWPNLFVPDLEWTGKIDPDGFGKMDRAGVRMRLENTILAVHWWYNPDKVDYRMRNANLRRAGKVGDILKVERAAKPDGYDYEVEIIPQAASHFAKFEALCTKRVRNSLKRYGYY